MHEIQNSLKMLREDAIERHMDDLAIAYGWSAIRLGEQILSRKMTDNERYRMCLKPNKPVSRS